MFINGNNPHQLIKTQEPPASQQTHHSIPHNIKVHQNPITASFAYPSPSTSLHHRNLNFGVVFHSHLVLPLSRLSTQLTTMGTNTAQRGSTGIASATTTPTHHRTRSRMDEVLQAASSNGLQSAASNASPSRGKKRKVIALKCFR